MKVLFVVTAYFPDGAGSGRSVRNLAEGMQSAGHDVVVVRLSRDGSQSETMIDGVKVYALPMRNIYNLAGHKKHASWKKLLWHIFDSFNLWAMRDFKKILKKEKPDVVNTSVIAGFSTGIFYTVKSMGIPLVHTMRDYYLMCVQNAMFNGGQNCKSICTKCRPFFEMRKQAVKKVDLFLSNSQFVEDHHKKFGLLPKDANCAVQLNMNIDDQIAPPKAFPENRKICFGFIGRVTDTKGIDILLQATQNLKTENWVLKIGGKGNPDYIAELKNKYGYNKTQFLGFVNPDEFYEDIDILICPSIYGEPLPRVVYEAYRAALPVIVSDRGGTPEIVDHGKNGFVYEARNYEQLAAYMDKIASDKALYESMSKASAEKAKLFTRAYITKQFTAQLEKVIEK